MKKIKCVELNKIYNSTAEACKELNLQKSNVSAVLNGRLKTCCGYHFEYVDNTDDKEQNFDVDNTDDKEQKFEYLECMLYEELFLLENKTLCYLKALNDILFVYAEIATKTDYTKQQFSAVIIRLLKHILSTAKEIYKDNDELISLTFDNFYYCFEAYELLTEEIRNCLDDFVIDCMNHKVDKVFENNT